jgi:hypothetical protein
MNRREFYQHLDELAEIWYIDASPRLIDVNAIATGVPGNRRSKMRINITNEQLALAVEAVEDEANPSGYPIVERWRHNNQPEIVNIRHMADKYL